MTPSPLHDLRPGFEEDNPLVEFLLGLHALAWTRAFPEAPQAPEATPDGEPAPDDGFIDFVLGLLALASRLERLLEAEAPPRPPEEPALSRTALSALRDLLR